MTPHIICHMVASIDGRIDCSMVDKISGDEYYTTLDTLDCKATVEGRITMQHYYALPGTFQAESHTPIGWERINITTGRRDFHICPDTKGTLLWESAEMTDGRPLLMLLSENASEEYLDYLDSKQISYIATGSTHIDLHRAMSILAEQYGIERIAVLGGGLINGGFLAAGLIHEISLLLAPGIDGRQGWRALFDGIADQHKSPTHLKLNTVERLANDVLWLRYTIATR